jgi:hypothetical protein
MALFPDADLTIACLTNTDVSRLPMQLPYFFADTLLGLPKSKDWLFEVCTESTQGSYDDREDSAQGYLPDRIANKPCLHDLSSLIGTYFDPVYGDISILKRKEGEEEQESLFVKLRQWEGKLEHYHFDTFHTVMKDFAVVLGTLITFQTDATGKVNGLEVQLQDDIFKFVRKEVSKH